MTTLTECELLALDVADFRHLMRQRPELRAEITRVAAGRIDAAHAAPERGE